MLRCLLRRHRLLSLFGESEREVCDRAFSSFRFTDEAGVADYSEGGGNVIPLCCKKIKTGTMKIVPVLFL
jgi:hypothetical protein